MTNQSTTRHWKAPSPGLASELPARPSGPALYIAGDTLSFTVEAMGQRVASRLTVFDDKVHAVFEVPPFLALFADKIRAKLAKEGPKLLE